MVGGMWRCVFRGVVSTVNWGGRRFAVAEQLLNVLLDITLLTNILIIPNIVPATTSII